MKDELEALHAEVRGLVERQQALEAGTDVIEQRGSRGCDNLLFEMIGKRVRLQLADGRPLEGTLVKNQLRCLRLDTDKGEQVVNTRFIDTLEVIGPGTGRKRKSGKGGKR